MAICRSDRALLFHRPPYPLRRLCYSPPVSDPANLDDVVTLARFGELTAAQLLCGRLDAEGIECFMPDEHIATQAWHFTHAIGGIRVQVRQADLERAKEILAQPGAADLVVEGDLAQGTSRPGQGESAGEADKDDGTISAGDRAAFRALRVALVSLWLMGLIHPYSLWLSVRALGRQDITAWGRRRAGIALIISVAGCAWIGLLVVRFAALVR